MNNFAIDITAKYNDGREADILPIHSLSATHKYAIGMLFMDLIAEVKPQDSEDEDAGDNEEGEGEDEGGDADDGDYDEESEEPSESEESDDDEEYTESDEEGESDEE